MYTASCRSGPTNINGNALSPQFVKERDLYWIKESKAPSGYVLNDEVKTIIPGTDRYTLQQLFSKTVNVRFRFVYIRQMQRMESH